MSAFSRCDISPLLLHRTPALRLEQVVSLSSSPVPAIDMSSTFKDMFEQSSIRIPTIETKTAQRQNQWFLPAQGISREVITAEIQFFLGDDAFVRPGVGIADHDGQQGYWISAYRFLTSAMIAELKENTLTWHEERDALRARGLHGR